MFKNLGSKKLKQRLNFGYRVVIIMMAVSGVIAIIGLAALFGIVMNYVNGVQQADRAVKNCRIQVNIAARNVREMVLNEDTTSYASYRSAVDNCMNEINADIATLEATNGIDNDIIAVYEDALADWGEIGYSIMDDVEAGNMDVAAQRILNECVPALDVAVTAAKELDAETDELIAQYVALTMAIFIAGIVIILVFIAVSIVLAQRIGKVVVASITEPLGEVEKVAKELAAGNLHSTLEYRSDDEIGSLAHNIRKSVRILGSYVDDIGRAMQEFSSGNFDVQPEVEWKGDFVGILDAFMIFEKSMSDMVKNIQHVADQVKTGATQISTTSTDLAEGATEQAGVVEELTATIEDVSHRISDNAKNANDISQNVKGLGDKITVSNDKMKTMVDSMAEISETSQEISKIIATINDIASQTNLLALNASIEAARAGEAGKGFAVVADQVSLLASQSAEAAKESTALIETSVSAVEKGIVIADETAHQLEEVAADSKRITQEVRSVAEALETHAEAFKQVNLGVENINDVVQTNAATSQECAAASQEMSGEAETLDSLIREIKVAK